MKIKDGFLLKKIAGDHVVVPVRKRVMDFSSIIKLSETGAFIWKMLEKGAEKPEILSAMLEEYEVDEALAAQDIDRFVEKLKDGGVLE